MDSFFQDINFDIYKLWIENLSIAGVKIEKKPNDESVIYFKKDKILGITAFYRDYLVEHEIIDTYTNERLYYMHYQFIDFKFSLSIFNDFINTLKKFHNQKQIKVLLCCSVGYTSTYFAHGIKEFCKLIKAPIEIDAGGYLQIDDVSQNYQLILLAPQIAYLQPKLLLKYQRNVFSIPPRIFATNDYKHVVDFILKQDL